MLVATLFFTVSASAQNGGGGGRGERIKHYLVDSLNVSATNADSVIAISQRSMMQLRPIIQDQSLSQDEKKDKVKPIREAAKAEMKKYLTADQMEKLEQKQMEWRQNRGGGNGGKK